MPPGDLRLPWRHHALEPAEQGIEPTARIINRMIGTNMMVVSKLLPALMIMPPSPEIPEPCSHAEVFGIVCAPADAAARDATGTWPAPK
jgi:hypothetical protein